MPRTTIDTPLAEVLARRAGVCQDFAHLMIGALRSLGLAARYISGYLLTATHESGASGAPMLGADASHAWVGVWCPRADGAPARWLELDPTNNLLASSDHVRLALGRDFGDVTPLRGVIRGGGEHELEVRVRTRRLGLAPMRTGKLAEDLRGVGMMDHGFDEMHSAPDLVREHYRSYARWLAEQPADVMRVAARGGGNDLPPRRHHLRRLRREGRGRRAAPSA